MAGKNFASLNRSFFSTHSSSILIATLSLLTLASIIFFFLSSSGCLAGDSPTYTHLPSTLPLSQNPHPNSPPPEYSFVSSLEKFLTSRSSKESPPSDTAASDGAEAAARALDDAIWRRETYDRVALSVVRVYVYEMPAKFTYDLLRLFQNTYKDTANLTSNGSPVHRLIEQHSIDYWLWADLIAPQSERLLKNVIRVHQQEEADLFYIPFFTTISYFLLERQQCKTLYKEALKWVINQPAWQRSEGRDHILPVHHPWSFKSARRYMKKAIWILPDMDATGNWYKPGQVWLEKDLILPYVPNLDLCDSPCLRESHSKRTTLLFFRGRLKRNAGGKVRTKLVEILLHTEGVVIEEGSIGVAGKEAAQNGMRNSLFCLSPAGDTPSSARLFDAIVSGCIPVIVSDELELPFEGLLDYRKIALFISSTDAVQPGWLVEFLRSFDSRRIKEMQESLENHSRHFLYSNPAQPLGAEDFTWRMIAGKLVNIKLHIRRSQRMVKGSRNLCSCECRPANITSVPKLTSQGSNWLDL